MVTTTSRIRFPGVTVRWTLSETRLRTVTVTVIQEPAAPSDPDDGDTVTLLFGLRITKLTGPPTAVTRNVPLAALPLTADSTSPFGVTCRVPGVGGGDDEGDGEGEGDGDGGGEDGAGADDRGVPGDVLWSAVGLTARDVVAPGVTDAGVGVRLGLAGLRQFFQPGFTAKEIFHMQSDEALPLVRELGVANLATGVVGLLSLAMSTFTLPIAISAGIFYGVAGIRHVTERGRSLNETVAMASDLFLFMVLAIFVAASLTAR